jgi:hypothetical protein
MKRSGESSSLAFTQAEFAYILLFIALGALALLFLQYRAAAEEVAFLLERIEKMEEKKNAAYPCWIRPDGYIPKVAGTLTIYGRDKVEIVRTSGGRSMLLMPEEGWGTGNGSRQAGIFRDVKKLFSKDTEFGSCNHCYIRVQIINKTNDYSLFLESAKVLKTLGIVVVNE